MNNGTSKKNEASDCKFVTGKWYIVNDQSNSNYDVGNEIIYDKKYLNSNLCDHNDAYISVKGHQVTRVDLKVKHDLLNAS